MELTLTAHACDVVIFGAKGDLSCRKLLPALYKLEKAGHIHLDTRIIGVGRAAWDKDIYKTVVRKSLDTFLEEKVDDILWLRLSTRLYFCDLDVHDTHNFINLAKIIDQKKNINIYYLAMPPTTFGAIFKGLYTSGLNKKTSRIVMEKPLGTDLQSSRLINNELAKFFDESQVYRIDHYLGKETVLNLMALRFANSLFANNWDNSIIDYVQITVAEEVGIEGRWGYFDSVGQMRDMVQNHLLQILTIIAMSPPSDLSSDRIRDEKVKVLRAMRRIDSSNVRDTTVRGQYTSGIIQGKKVPGYLEEKGANKNSHTETFVSIRVDIDNCRWTGVPFYLCTGKRMSYKYSEVVLFFKNPLINLFTESCKNLPRNKLRIRLHSDAGIQIEILHKMPGIENKYRLQTTTLDLKILDICHQANLPDAYERLLLEIMRGIQVLFVRRDEVEEAWKWVDSIEEAWSTDNEYPQPYEAGTWGPRASYRMIPKE
ncbi:glucose-6-phosphate dehydrogenase [Candidatus Profftia tarda]|nr:glucose-6-phosphate dehydrogenase [Candidatus Profftia tarda]